MDSESGRLPLSAIKIRVVKKSACVETTYPSSIFGRVPPRRCFAGKIVTDRKGNSGTEDCSLIEDSPGIVISFFCDDELGPVETNKNTLIFPPNGRGSQGW